MAVYTYLNIRTAVNGKIHRKIGNLADPRETINSAARDLWGDLDLRSAKRKASVSPNIFDDVYEYACPTDLKGISLIDIIPQVNREVDSEFDLTTEEQFDRRKTVDKMMVAFADDVMARKLKISFTIDDDQLVISEMDTLSSGGGTWAAFGDAENVVEDDDDFVRGSGSIKFGISSAGGTTAGIENSTMDVFDMTDFLANGSAFVWAKITSVTGLTNYILKIYDGAGKAVTKTVTADHAGNAFAAGNNLLRFDMNTATVDSGFDPETCSHVRLYMTKLGSKVSETDYHFDWLVLKRGKIHQVLYYSKYPWQTSAGVWIENSTADTDKINMDTEEFEMLLDKAAEKASQELEKYNDVKYFKADYRNPDHTGKADRYELLHPSESKLLTTDYRNT